MPGPGYKRKEIRKKTYSPPAPVSSGGGLAEAYQERRGGHPRAARQTVATNSTLTPTTTPVAQAPSYARPTPATPQPATPAPETLVPLALDAAQQFKVSPALLMGVMETASRFQPKRRIGEESGLGMFGPRSRREYGVEEGDSPKAVRSQVNGLAAMLSDADANTDPVGALSMWGGRDRDFPLKVVEAAEKFRDLDEQLGAPKQPKGRKVARKLKRAVANSTEIDGPLTPEQKEFAASFARASGLSPRVAAAAVLREGGNGTPGDNNWLNIGWTDSGPTEITRDPAWRDPKSAGEAAGKWIRGEWGDQYGYTAAPSIQEIPRQKGDAAQMRAWANSGWASSGASPADTYGQVSASTRDVPKKLIDRARDTLGKKRTNRILRGSTGSTVKPPSRKEIGKWLVPTESRAEIASELGVPRKRAGMAINRINPEIQARLIEVAKESGEPIRINEGFRTTYRQQQLASGQGGATGPAAAPGTSQHEEGNAVDADLTAKQTALLAKHGLSNQVVPGEPWHIQLAEGTGSSSAPVAGGGAGAPAPAATGNSTGGTSWTPRQFNRDGTSVPALPGGNVPLPAHTAQAVMPEAIGAEAVIPGDESMIDLLESYARPRRRLSRS